MVLALESSSFMFIFNKHINRINNVTVSACLVGKTLLLYIKITIY